jgi:hypothetical protein
MIHNNLNQNLKSVSLCLTFRLRSRQVDREKVGEEARFLDGTPIPLCGPFFEGCVPWMRAVPECYAGLKAHFPQLHRADIEDVVSLAGELTTFGFFCSVNFFCSVFLLCFSRSGDLGTFAFFFLFNICELGSLRHILFFLPYVGSEYHMIHFTSAELEYFT